MHCPPSMMNEIQCAVILSALDMYCSSSLAKGMPIGLSLVGRTSCSHMNGIITCGILRFPPRSSGGKARRRIAWWCLQAKQTTMASLHSTAQLERRIAAQTPGVSVERTDRPEDYLRSQLPALDAMPAVVPAVDKLRTLLAASFCFEPETLSPAYSRIGASRLSYWSRDVDGACDGSSFSGSPGPGQFGFRNDSL